MVKLSSLFLAALICFVLVAPICLPSPRASTLGAWPNAAHPRTTSDDLSGIEVSQDEQAPFDKCVAKLKRFEGTEATEQSRARFFFGCAFRAGQWQVYEEDRRQQENQ
jgi:hypothetical protein